MSYTFYNCKVCDKQVKKSHHHTNQYCSIKCHAILRRKTRIDEWLKGKKYNNRDIPAWLKEPDGYLAQRDGYKCSECGVGNEYNHKRLVLECDHIDGDHTNQNEKNLRLLCPNCHSQTDTFKGRNK